MAQATISIRTDADLKQDFERLCQDIGMNLTTAFNIFMKQAVRENAIPVELTCDPFYTRENVDRIARAAARLDAGLGTEHELIEVDE